MRQLHATDLTVPRVGEACLLISNGPYVGAFVLESMACMKPVSIVLSFRSQEQLSECAVLLIPKVDCVNMLCWQVAVEDIIADGRLRLAVQTVFDETQLAAALQVQRSPMHVNAMLLQQQLDIAGE